VTAEQSDDELPRLAVMVMPEQAMHGMEEAHQRALCLWIEQAITHLWGTAVLEARGCLFDVELPLCTGMSQSAYDDLWAFLLKTTPNVRTWKESYDFYQRQACKIMTTYNDEERRGYRVPRASSRRSVRGASALAVRVCTECGGRGVSLVFQDTGKCMHCMRITIE
jgi:hypothetical protein